MSQGFRMKVRRAGVTCAAVLLAAAVHADPSPNQGLTGDWGGARTRWYEHGLDFQFSYFAEPAYNAEGGEGHLLRSADQFIAGATLDLDKLWGVPKAKVQITLTDRNGNNLSSDAQLGTLLQVQQVYGRGNILRLTEFSYEQLFLDGALDVKLGRLGVGGSFYVWSCQFMNLSFCGELPGNIVSTWYNWPVSQWGARTRVRITQDLKIEVGVYEVNPSYLENQNGTALNPSGKIGNLVPMELDWTPRWGPAALPGTYRFGYWYDSSDLPDVFLAQNYQPLVLTPGVPPLVRGHESGTYVNAQQQITATDGDRARGLSVFFNYVGADENTATISQLLSIGIFDVGRLPSRPRDVFGFAVGRNRVNPRVADGQRLQNASGTLPVVPVQNAEYPVEMFYNCRATAWLSLSPAVQYIIRPGGTNANHDVLVLGLNFGATF
jgi:porin